MQLQRIGTLIREGRIKKGMNQTELAKLLHVSVAAVSKWETGKNNPDMSNMEGIARILDIPIQELLGISASADAAASGDVSEPGAASEADEEGKKEPWADTESRCGSISISESGAEAAPETTGRISLKKTWPWILSAVLLGFCVGGFLFWIYRAPFAQQETTIVTDYRGDTVYGSTCYVVLEYSKDPTNDFLNEQAVGFRGEYPKYFKGVDAVLLLYYKQYDASRDDESTADFMVLILN